MKLCQAVIVMCVLAVGTLSWAYPVNVTTELSPEVTSIVQVINSGGMQIATVHFMVEGYPCGSYTLTSMAPLVSSPPPCRVGNTILTVSRITFQSASPYSPGRVQFEGSVTSKSDNQTYPINFLIAEWTY